MTNFRILLVVLLGITLIHGIPTPKPTPKLSSKSGATTRLASRSALKSKTLAIEEKKISKSEDSKMAIESAEEPRTGDRKKKSTATTFCVEIRPSPSEPPTQVCNPQLPVQHHEHHEHHEHHVIQTNPPAQQPSVDQEVPIVIDIQPQEPPHYVPAQPTCLTCVQPQPVLVPCPEQPLNIPSAQPQQPTVNPGHHHQQTPSIQFTQDQNVNPAPCSSIYGSIVPHGHPTGITYFHSNGRTNPGVLDDSMLEMRNMENAGFNTIETLSQQVLDAQGVEDPDAIPFERTIGKNFANNGRPFSQNGQHQTPVIIQMYPQSTYSKPCSSGMATTKWPRDGSVGSLNGDAGTMTEPMAGPQMNTDMASTRAQAYQPIMSSMPNVGYMSASSSMYTPSSGYQTYPRVYNSYQFPVTSGINAAYRQQIRQQREQSDDEGAEEIEKEEKTSQQSDAISPSQILNKMRGFDGEKINPTLKTFSRDNDDLRNEGTRINVHIPSSGQPIVTTSNGPRGKNNNEEKPEVTKHDETAKREVKATSGPGRN